MLSFTSGIDEREPPQRVARIARFDIQLTELNVLRLPRSTGYRGAGNLESRARHRAPVREGVVDDVSAPRCDAYRAAFILLDPAQRETFEDQRARVAREPCIRDPHPAGSDRPCRR